jgi:PKD repeat protein
MAEKEPAAAKPRGWLKMAVGAVGGVVSGVIAMYLTAAVNWVAKPARPVANFRFDVDGLTVRFNDLSTGGQGWWDFGDGSPMEPVSPERPTVQHAYPRPGDYTVKMSLRNLLGEEHERTVTVHLDGTVTASAPKVLNLEAVPISPGAYAPATFRLSSKVSNARLCVWDLGDNQPMEIENDPSNGHDRLVTFQRPGRHVIKLAAFNGSQNDQKTEIITVKAPPAGSVMAVLTVTDTATQVETSTQPVTLAAAFPPEHKEAVYRFEKVAVARPGHTIADLRVLAGKDPRPQLGTKMDLTLDAAALGLRNARNLRLQLAPDRQSVKLTGELVKDAAVEKGKAALPGVALPLVLTEQRRIPAQQSQIGGTMALTVPSGANPSGGSMALPPLPADWVDAQRKVRLELRDGDKVLWQGSDLPNNASVTLGQKRCLLTATRSGDQVRINLATDGGRTRPPT